MTRPNSTEIIVVLDRSGSMASIAADMRGGFDNFIAEQRKLPGECHVTLARFDNGYELVYQRLPLSEVPPLKLEPRGGTALFDALGQTIFEVGLRLSTTPENERPEKVLVLVITDGEENASRRYSAISIKSMIQHQTSKYNWQFVYIGANQDAMLKGTEIGIQTTTDYTADKHGTHKMWNSANIGTRSYRSGGGYHQP